MIRGWVGRLANPISGLALVCLSISGGRMRADLWSRRRKGGKAALF